MGMAIVASTPGLAHTAWLSLRRLQAQVLMLGEPCHLAAARRMDLTVLPGPEAVDGDLLRSLVGSEPAFPAGERAHVRMLRSGVECLGHQDAALIRKLGDKRAYPELARKCGFRTPPLLDAPDGAWQVLEKPRWGFGAIGVRPFPPGAQRLPRTILQPHVGHRDLDVSIAAHEGRVVASTAERPIDASMRLYGHAPQAEMAVRALVEGTGYSGLMHVDMRVDEEGPWVVDINPRLWATHWMAAAMGMDFIRAYLDAHAGRKVRFRRRTGVFAAPWRWPAAMHHGRPRMTAPLRAAWQRRRDRGIMDMLRYERRAPRQDVTAWPEAF